MRDYQHPSAHKHAAEPKQTEPTRNNKHWKGQKSPATSRALQVNFSAALSTKIIMKSVNSSFTSQLGEPSLTKMLRALSSVGKGRAADVTYLGLCKAADTVLHGVLVSKAEAHRLEGWPLLGSGLGWMAALKELWSVTPCPDADQ